MGLGDERIVNPEAVSKSLRCVICTDVFIDPVSANGPGHCQHVFCRSCIEQALRRRRACPSCNAPMYAVQLVRNIVVQSLLDEIRIKCSLPDCTWTGPQDQLQAHEDACPVLARDCLRRTVLAQQLQLNKLQEEVDRLARECVLREVHERQMESKAERLEMQVEMMEEGNREKDHVIARQRWKLDQVDPGICEARLQAHMQAKDEEVSRMAEECSLREVREREMEMQLEMLEQEGREKDDLIAGQRRQLDQEKEEALRAQLQAKDQEAHGNLNWIQVKRVDWEGDLSVNPSRIKGFQVAVTADGRGTLLLKSITQAAEGICRGPRDGGS
ncbi:RAG1 [Symbiodinium natans]|uniref:RAG1 protein n=1 Tax=Symbiodinium natans TaxID=878477 RepID=A0A812N3X2_9DINO|nr:RAG1 [Symbiodinium natans]